MAFFHMEMRLALVKFPCALNDFRRALISRFPFEIFYELRLKVFSFTRYFPASKTPQIGAGGLAAITKRT
jgi:hypothetical protein